MFPIQQFLRFAMNPVQYFNQMGIQIPKECQTPDQMIQYFMNSGKLNQQQYNYIAQQSNQIKKDPQFTQAVNSVQNKNIPNINIPNTNISGSNINSNNSSEIKQNDT